MLRIIWERINPLKRIPDKEDDDQRQQQGIITPKRDVVVDVIRFSEESCKNATSAIPEVMDEASPAKSSATAKISEA